jgi:hypothetical protein
MDYTKDHIESSTPMDYIKDHIESSTPMDYTKDQKESSTPMGSNGMQLLISYWVYYMNKITM